MTFAYPPVTRNRLKFRQSKALISIPGVRTASINAGRIKGRVRTSKGWRYRPRSCENRIVLSIVENVGNANPDIFATHD